MKLGVPLRLRRPGSFSSAHSTTSRRSTSSRLSHAFSKRSFYRRPKNRCASDVVDDDDDDYEEEGELELSLSRLRNDDNDAYNRSLSSSRRQKKDRYAVDVDYWDEDEVPIVSKSTIKVEDARQDVDVRQTHDDDTSLYHMISQAVAAAAVEEIRGLPPSPVQTSPAPVPTTPALWPFMGNYIGPDDAPARAPEGMDAENEDTCIVQPSEAVYAEEVVQVEQEEWQSNPSNGTYKRGAKKPLRGILRRRSSQKPSGILRKPGNGIQRDVGEEQTFVATSGQEQSIVATPEQDDKDNQEGAQLANNIADPSPLLEAPNKKKSGKPLVSILRKRSSQKAREEEETFVATPEQDVRDDQEDPEPASNVVEPTEEARNEENTLNTSNNVGGTKPFIGDVNKCSSSLKEKDGEVAAQEQDVRDDAEDGPRPPRDIIAETEEDTGEAPLQEQENTRVDQKVLISSASQTDDEPIKENRSECEHEEDEVEPSILETGLIDVTCSDVKGFLEAAASATVAATVPCQSWGKEFSHYLVTNVLFPARDNSAEDPPVIENRGTSANNNENIRAGPQEDVELGDDASEISGKTLFPSDVVRSSCNASNNYVICRGQGKDRRLEC